MGYRSVSVYLYHSIKSICEPPEVQLSLVCKRLTLSFNSYFCCLMYAWITYQSPYSEDPRHSKKAMTTASPQTTQVTEACDDDSYNTNTRLSHKLFLVPDDDQQPLQISSLCVSACPGQMINVCVYVWGVWVIPCSVSVCVVSCGYGLSQCVCVSVSFHKQYLWASRGANVTCL